MTYYCLFQDEKNQILALNAWLLYAWKDNKLGWDPADFGGLKVGGRPSPPLTFPFQDIRFPYGTIWKPDVLLYNSEQQDPEIVQKAIHSHVPNIIFAPNSYLENPENIALVIREGFYDEPVEWVGTAVGEGTTALKGKIPMYAGLYLPDLPTPTDLSTAVQLSVDNKAEGVSLFGGVSDEHWQAFQDRIALLK